MFALKSSYSELYSVTLQLALDEKHSLAIFANKPKLECGPMPNMMAALPNRSGALCSMPQRFG